MFSLDRSVFKIQTFQEADNTVNYWLKETPLERWRAAWFITCAAYGIDCKNPPRLDRQHFSVRKNGQHT